MSADSARHPRVTHADSVRWTRAPAFAHESARATAGEPSPKLESASPEPRAPSPESRSEGPMTNLLQDLRHAVRLMGRSPGFTLAALVTLALAIGANTAVFSVVYGVLLRPLPYPGAERIVRISEEHPGGTAIVREAMISNLTLDAWRAGARTVDAVLDLLEPGLHRERRRRAGADHGRLRCAVRVHAARGHARARALLSG